MKNPVLNDLLFLAESGDLSLATRRLMDLSLEHAFSPALRRLVLDLRAEYNSSRELGTRLDNDKQKSLAQKAASLLALIEKEGPLPEIPVPAPPEVVIKARGITKHYNDSSSGFKLGPLDVEIKTGTLTGLVGENGNGKTTLLRILAGLLHAEADSMEYIFDGNNVYDWFKIKHRIAYIPQRIPRWFGTLAENLKFAAAIHGLTGNENEEHVEYVIHRLGLTNFRHLTWKQLSSGYKLRFELARALVWHPRLLILDEPLGNLDINAKQLFLQDLSLMARSSRYPFAAILSSQQLHEVENVSDDVIFLQNGNPVYNGKVGSIGHDRDENSFEISGNFDRRMLIEELCGFDKRIRIEDSGIAVIVHTPRDITGLKLMQEFINRSMEIHYFRDISTSTRKLFNAQI